MSIFLPKMPVSLGQFERFAPIHSREAPVPQAQTVPGSAAAIRNIANNTDARSRVDIGRLTINSPERVDGDVLQRELALLGAG